MVDRDAGADTDEQFPCESVLHAGLGEDVFNHIRFTAEDDDIGCLDATDVFVLEDRDRREVGVGLYGEFDSFGGFGATHAGDEFGGCEERRFRAVGFCRRAVGDRGCGAGVRVGGGWSSGLIGVV